MPTHTTRRKWRLLAACAAAMLLISACKGTATEVIAVDETAVPPTPTATPSPTPTPTPRPGQWRYVALGDSIAAGVGASEPAAKGYAGLLDAYNRAKHPEALPVLNLAVSGESSTTYFNGQRSRAAGALNDGPEVRLITITIGANDYLRSLGPACFRNGQVDEACLQRGLTQALETFKGRFEALLGELTAPSPGKPVPIVVVTTYYNPYGGMDTSANPMLARIEAWIDAALLGVDGKVDCSGLNDQANVGLNDILTCQGRERGAVIVDLYPIFQGHTAILTRIMEGNQHPTDEGYRLIADAIIRAIELPN